MAALNSQAATDVYESADDYDDVAFVRDANQHDWSHECNILAMTQSDLNNLPKRFDDVTTAHKIRTNDGDLGGTPTQLNFKQLVAFGLFRRHILNVKIHGQDNVQQLLLNISGAAGSGKSFFLNTVKRLVKVEHGRDGVVQAAARSGTATHLINGKTLHSFFYLPVGTSKCLPLHGERLKGMHDTFSNVGILFIDEKSMAGQKTFTMVSKRFQKARPHYKDKPFGNRSVVLLGDFQQLSPVCDSPLFNANVVNPSGYNINPLFDKAITFTELVQQR